MILTIKSPVEINWVFEFSQTNMNGLQTAIHSWNEEKNKYQKSIKTVVAELSKPIPCIPSPDYDSKRDELREYLKYDYTYDEEDRFNEVYVQHIVGNSNTTLMQLTNKLVGELGGTLKFWQNKVLDIAVNISFHADLSLWQINKAYQHYMGLSPEFTQNLRKKQSHSKHYIAALSSICKQIEKSKPTQEDLLKIDQLYKRLKKCEEVYVSFIEVTEGFSSKEASSISMKGKNIAKNDLFVFHKPKEEKVNTLANYNFRVQREEVRTQIKLLKGQQYQNFDRLFQKLNNFTISQRQSAYSQASQSKCNTEEKEETIPINEIRGDFARFMGNDRLQTEEKKEWEDQNTFIWSSEYYFTYWGFPVKYQWEIDFTQPFKIYEQINYEIDSEDEYDELNAEDVEGDDSLSEDSSISSTSFVVEDDYASEDERERETVLKTKMQVGSQRWQKHGQELKEYQIINIWAQDLLPLPFEESIDSYDEQFLQRLQGKGRFEIVSLITAEKKDISKHRIEMLLRNNFKKIKNKSKQIVYVRNREETAEKQGDVIEVFSDPDTSAEIIEISISCPTRQISSQAPQEMSQKQNRQETRNSRSKEKPRSSRSRSKNKNINNDTILEELSSKGS